MSKKNFSRRSRRVPNARKSNVVTRLCKKLSTSAYDIFVKAFRYVYEHFDSRKVKDAYSEYKDKRKIPPFVRSYGSHILSGALA